jgi:hypothetical protein
MGRLTLVLFAAVVMATFAQVGQKTMAADADVAGKSPSEIRCDELAGHPLDTSNTERTGLEFPDLEKQADAAITACRQATAEQPGNVRLIYQLARAFDAGKQFEVAHSLYEAAANMGHSLAMGGLGSTYLDGRGTEPNAEIAARWFRKAVQKGDAASMVALGILHVFGQGVPQDDDKALGLMQDAINRGSAQAMYMLGVMYTVGRGVKRDELTAAYWRGKAVENGFVPSKAEAQGILEILRVEGRSTSSDLQNIVRGYQDAASDGDAQAMYNLGLLYASGQGVPLGYGEALGWLNKAAEAGHADAMILIGGFYISGLGVARDDKEGARWFRKAAAKGDAEAMYGLGELHLAGRGVVQDYRQALVWLKKSAAKGHAEAMATIGGLYAEGLGVTRNGREAFRWNVKGAEKGSARAMVNLAELHRTGFGVASDQQKAAQLVVDVFKTGDDSVAELLSIASRDWSPQFWAVFQQALKAEGVYDGPVDGTFGTDFVEQIRDAIKRLTESANGPSTDNQQPSEIKARLRQIEKFKEKLAVKP